MRRNSRDSRPGARRTWRWFCIDASAIPDVDYSAAETLKSLFAALQERGIRLVVAQVLDVDPDDRYEMQKLFGKDALYSTLGEVVEAYQQDTRTQAD